MLPGVLLLPVSEEYLLPFPREIVLRQGTYCFLSCLSFRKRRFPQGAF